MSDVDSIETIVPALYACISGRAGAPRDWGRFRSLLRPDARFLRSVTDTAGHVRAQEFGVEGYIADVAPFLAANDFQEIQTELRVERAGRVAHAWSRYEAGSRRGVNSIQLWHDGARWWIVSVVWEAGMGSDPET